MKKYWGGANNWEKLRRKEKIVLDLKNKLVWGRKKTILNMSELKTKKIWCWVKKYVLAFLRIKRLRGVLRLRDGGDWIKLQLLFLRVKRRLMKNPQPWKKKLTFTQRREWRRGKTSKNPKIFLKIISKTLVLPPYDCRRERVAKRSQKNRVIWRWKVFFRTQLRFKRGSKLCCLFTDDKILEIVDDCLTISIFFELIEMMRTEEKLCLEFDVSKDSHSQFLSGHSSSQIPHIVHFFVLKNLCNHVSCWDTFRSFSCLEFA